MRQPPVGGLISSIPYERFDGLERMDGNLQLFWVRKPLKKTETKGL